MFTLRQKTSVLSQGVMQHSSEKGGLCSTFCSSEMLQISKFEFYLINALVYVRALGGNLIVGGPTLVKFLENVFQKHLYLVNSQQMGVPWPTCQ